jgi:uncharacterized protein YbaR (Trm112 family)
MKKAKAQLSWELMIECPVCECPMDLVESDFEGQYSKPIFSNQWDVLKGEEVMCDHCHLVFQIEEVEY